MSRRQTPEHRWWVRHSEHDIDGPSKRAWDIADSLFSGTPGGHDLILSHMDHGVLICEGRAAVENVQWPLTREIARAVDAAYREGCGRHGELLDTLRKLLSEVKQVRGYDPGDSSVDEAMTEAYDLCDQVAKGREVAP